MKLKQLLILAASALSLGANAQTVDQIGYGTIDNNLYGPFRNTNSNEDNGRIYAYKAAELNAIGITPGSMIHSLKWYKIGEDSLNNNAHARMILYIRENPITLPVGGYVNFTSVPEYTDTAFVAYDTVDITTAYNLAGEGWKGFSGFNFEYTGNDLEVYIRYEMLQDIPGLEYTAQLQWRCDSTSEKYLLKSDNSYVGNFIAHLFRPNTQFEFDAATCGNLYGGTTISSASTNVCPGTNIELDLQNETYAPGQTEYTWETAPSASGPWTTYSVALPQPVIGLGAPSATTWYRALVTCGSASAYSTPLEVQVNPGLTGTFTINNAFPTGGNNFHSYTDAAAALNCGVSGPVTFNTVPGSGPYEEKIIINEVAGASAINKVTFNGNGTILKQPDDTTGGLATIKLNGADYITFNGLVIKTTPNFSSYEYMYGQSVQMTNDADYNVVKNCDIENRPIDWYVDTAKYGAIVINGDGPLPVDGMNSNCDHNSIMNNTIKGGYYAIAIAGDNSNPLQGNIVSGNTLVDFVEYGVYAANAAGTVVDSNNLSRPTKVNLREFYGIYLTAQSGAMVTANKVHDPAATNENSPINAIAIRLSNSMITDSNKNVIANNVVYNMNSLGGNAGIALSGVQGVNIYHNTISLENANTFCGGCMGAYGIYQHLQPASDVSVKNNIITISGTGDAAQQPLHFDDTLSGVEFNNNNYFFSDGTSGATNITFMGGISYETLLDWQVAIGAEQNSVSSDPQYVDVVNGNLAPGNVNIDNLGQIVNIATDINGVVRSTISPDMGAYEFGTIPVPVSVNNVTTKGLSIYPNPATDAINISAPEKVRAIVLSIDGRKMIEQDNATRIDMKALSEGTYILQLINKDGIIVETEKVIMIK